MQAWRAAAVVVLLGFSACGDDDDAPADTIDAGIVPDAPGCIPGTDAAVSGQADDVTGTWAVLQLATAVSTAVSAEQISRNIHVYTMVQGEAGAVTLTDKLCELVVTNSQLDLTISLQPKAVASVQVLDRTGQLTGTAFTTAKAYTQRGVLLENIETDPLPEEATDPRLVDGEDDGHPGVTLILRGFLMGSIYVAQRDWNAYFGTVRDADHIQGYADWGSEQFAYGGDPEEFVQFGINAIRAPGDEKHPIYLVRIPAGSDCAYVLANQCTLFGGK